jgi:3-hydroxybutyrate dehydrogenase
MARFDGKVAIITGAASGICKDIALHFAAEGGIPVIADLNLDAADATAKEIRANGCDAFAADETAVERGVARFGCGHMSGLYRCGADVRGP